MDILKPNIVIVEGRHYRFFDSNAWSQNEKLGTYEEESFEPVYETDEDASENNIEIVPHSGGRYKHCFHVPRAMFQFIIGKKGSTKARLEAETKTTVDVPKIGQNGDITIIGRDRRTIISCRHRIDLLVETSRKKIPATHFLSIPMNQSNIIDAFNVFKAEILENTAKGVRVVEDSLFQKAEKLHLTLDMLRLLDNEDRELATRTLLACHEKVVKPFLQNSGTISVEVRGIEYMNDDPSEVNILYAKIIDENGYLQNLADRVVDYFVNEGLIQRTYDRVKLHMTIMNSKFKLDSDKPWDQQAYQAFDASKIIKVHKDTYFGKVTISSIHISQRHTTSNSGYYQSTAKIEF